MRSVPHRVVCLVGLDDGVFPRSTVSDGDDALARRPADRRARRPQRGPPAPARRGARGRRDPGRHLHRRQRAHRSGAAAGRAARRAPRRPRARPHPGPATTSSCGTRLQPFDARNFAAGELGSAGPFSFDRASLDGARAARRAPPGGRRPAHGAAARRRSPATSTLADLQAFLAHPVRGFLRQRLDVGVPQEYDEVDDALPVELDALEAVGDRRPGAAPGRRRGRPGGVFLAEQLRGDLPPLRLGERDPDRRSPSGSTSSTRPPPRRASSRRAPSTSPWTWAAGAGSPGWCPTCAAAASSGSTTPTLSPKHRLASWVDLLALSAGLPDHSWTASTVRLAPVEDTDAVAPGTARPPGASSTCATWSTSSTGGCASRCRCRCAPRTPGPTRVRARKDPYWPACAEWETQDGSPVPGEQDGRRARPGPRPGGAVRLPAGQPRADERWNGPSRTGWRSTPCASGSRCSATSRWAPA